MGPRKGQFTTGTSRSITMYEEYPVRRAVDILNLTRYMAAAMRPVAVNSDSVLD